jgi:hypothetical protein
LLNLAAAAFDCKLDVAQRLAFRAGAVPHAARTLLYLPGNSLVSLLALKPTVTSVCVEAGQS